MRALNRCPTEEQLKDLIAGVDLDGKYILVKNL